VATFFPAVSLSLSRTHTLSLFFTHTHSLYFTHLQTLFLFSCTHSHTLSNTHSFSSPPPPQYDCCIMFSTVWDIPVLGRGGGGWVEGKDNNSPVGGICCQYRHGIHLVGMWLKFEFFWKKIIFQDVTLKVLVNSCFRNIKLLKIQNKIFLVY
jgi:hypothetical protein